MKTTRFLFTVVASLVACTPPMGRDPVPALDVVQVVPGTARVEDAFANQIDRMAERQSELSAAIAADATAALSLARSCPTLCASAWYPRFASGTDSPSRTAMRARSTQQSFSA